ncbi:MAG: hypothetical protein AAFV53_01690 [Myxococcota bacterium]
MSGWWMVSVMEAWACAGPGGVEKMQFAAQTATAMLALNGLFCVIGLVATLTRKRSWRPLVPLVVVSAAHPGVWMAPNPVDCGQGLQIAAIIFSIQGIALLGWVLARPGIEARIEEATSEEGSPDAPQTD